MFLALADSVWVQAGTCAVHCFGVGWHQLSVCQGDYGENTGFLELQRHSTKPWNLMWQFSDCQRVGCGSKRRIFCSLSVFWALKHLRWAGLTVPPNSEVSWGHVPVSSVDSQGCHEWAPCAYCCAALWVLGAQDCWCVLYDGDCSMNANNIKFGWGLASAEL